jgi:hypothetical protein
MLERMDASNIAIRIVFIIFPVDNRVICCYSIRVSKATDERKYAMMFRIHFTWPDGTDDSFDVQGETIEEIQQQAHIGIANRNGSNPWSEQLD